MARRAFVFDPPDRFVAGTVGEPGNRTFFLQAREGARVVSVALEKTQVAVLAERLGRLLLELEQRGIAELAAGAPPRRRRAARRASQRGVPGRDPHTRLGRRARDGPDRGACRDRGGGRPRGIRGDRGAERRPGRARPAPRPDQRRARPARSWSGRCGRSAAGRPPCPLCGNPLDPQGHICPRRNGQYVN